MSKARGLADLGNVYDDGALSNRNVIVNGGMTISQRSTSSTQTGTGPSYATVDRWELYRNSSLAPNITVSQSADAPSGFLNSMKVDVNATATPTGSQNFGFRTKIEGLDTGRFNRGTASAETMTLSFYVKSNKTGTYSAQIFDLGATIYSKLVAYTIDAADTWERKEITLQANTNSNSPTLSSSEGLRIAFDLGSGPDDVVPIFDWSTTYGIANRVASGQVNLLDSTSNYWQITGVQLEAGDTATPFEHPRSYGDELARCQRYFERWTFNSLFDWYVTSTADHAHDVDCPYNGSFAVAKRAIPTYSRSGTFVVDNLSSNDWTPKHTENTVNFYNSSSAAGRYYSYNSSTSAYFDFDAEL